MPIVKHATLPETPWRPNYRKWDVTRPEDGTTSSNLFISAAAPGAGAPLHTHTTDELIVLLEGELEVRIGDEIVTVGADHTLVIPPNMAHEFTVVGHNEARMLTFLPVTNMSGHTTYLDGLPPGKNDS